MPATELAPISKECSSDTVIRLAGLEDSQSIALAYEHVFGKSGVKAPGHEAYPAPSVFSAHGVRGIIEDPSRTFIVAECGGTIAGGMIVNHLSPYNQEFCCVAVDPAFRNRGISPRLISFARTLGDSSSFTVNSTEIVTHSLLSQTAHNRVGYNRVTGFGYCQYPRVFFARHPESVLWVTNVHGRVARALMRFSSHPDAASAAQAHRLNQEEQALLMALRSPRFIFVPDAYEAIVSEIAWQFLDTTEYRINPGSKSPGQHSNHQTGEKITADLCHGDPFGLISLPSCLYRDWESGLDNAIDSIKAQGKTYIQARIPANQASAIAYARYLQDRGFVLLGLLPLHRFFLYDDGGPGFDDLLVMQWVSPSVIAENPLPGETDSVIKLYGYPDNLSGGLLKVIRNEIRNIAGL